MLMRLMTAEPNLYLFLKALHSVGCVNRLAVKVCIMIIVRCIHVQTEHLVVLTYFNNQMATHKLKTKYLNWFPTTHPH